MKDGPFNDEFPFDGGKAKSDATTLTTLANYFVKFIQAYGELGMKIEIVSPQNEPGYSGTYPTCAWDPTAYATFVGKYLGPALSTASLQVKIMLGTFNAGTGDTDIVSTVMADATAKGYIKVLGYQWGMDANIASAKAYNVPIWQTEHKCGNYNFSTPYWDQSRYSASKPQNDHLYGEESWQLIRDWIVAGVSSYSAWNMVLDTVGMSLGNWPQNALLTVDRSAKKLNVTAAYYAFRHFSQYIQPNATRVDVKGSTDAVAFVNPDGSTITELYNKGSASLKTTVQVSGAFYQLDVPAHGWATLRTTP
jgi:glucosylceramidase